MRLLLQKDQMESNTLARTTYQATVRFIRLCRAYIRNSTMWKIAYARVVKEDEA